MSLVACSVCLMRCTTFVVSSNYEALEVLVLHVDKRWGHVSLYCWVIKYSWGWGDWGAKRYIFHGFP